jgi:hypothetical protein
MAQQQMVPNPQVQEEAENRQSGELGYVGEQEGMLPPMPLDGPPSADDGGRPAAQAARRPLQRARNLAKPDLQKATPCRRSR